MNEREEALNGLGQLLGFGCIVLHQYADAGAIGMHFPPVAHEWALLADKNEKVAKGIDYLTEAGPYAGVIVSMMPLVLQLAANHNLIKAEMAGGAGVVPPEALTAQVRADMARQAQEAMRAQHEAEASLAAMAAEMGPQDGSQGQPEANGRTDAPPKRGRQRAEAGTV